jgi:hypothetical protein
MVSILRVGLLWWHVLVLGLLVVVWMVIWLWLRWYHMLLWFIIWLWFHWYHVMLWFIVWLWHHMMLRLNIRHGVDA